MSFFDQIKERYDSLDPEARRLILIMIAVILLLLTIFSAVSGHIAMLEKRKIAREKTLKELLVLRQRHQEAAADTQRLTNRMAGVTEKDSPVTVIEQTGIVPKGGIQSKPLPRQDRDMLIEEGAEVTLSGLTLNETVNLLYRLEHGTKPVAIRKAVIRTRFSEPSKLDLTLHVALFRPASRIKP